MTPTDQPNRDAHTPRLAIRRHTDRCFHEVEEIIDRPDGTIEGYIIEGHLIPVDEVAQCRPMDPS